MKPTILFAILSLAFSSAFSQAMRVTPDSTIVIAMHTDGVQELFASALPVPNNSYQIFSVTVRSWNGIDSGRGKEVLHVKNSNGIYSIPKEYGFDHSGPGLWIISIINNLPVLKLVGQVGPRIDWVIRIKRQSI